MPDMLVKLYELPDLHPVLKQQRDEGIELRRALSPEKAIVVDWVRSHYGSRWASECDVSFSGNPPECFIALKADQLIGFGCHDSTFKGFFGPTGVIEAAQGKGTGKALLLACLHDLRVRGYAYAIIGAAGPTSFYEKAVGAVIIPGSSPGMYAGLLPDPEHN